MAIVDKYISHITPLGSPDTYKLKAYLLKNGRTFKVQLNSTNASTAFDGSADITDIGVSGILGVANGGTGNNLFTKDTLIYANTATKLASYTSTNGGAKKLWYLNAGVPTDSAETVGATDKPVFLSSGTITESTSNIGSGIIPIYMASGQIKASTSTVGDGEWPVYLNSGTIAKTTYYLKSNIEDGSANQLAYYSTARTIDYTPKIYYINSLASTAEVPINMQGLRIVGGAAGNDSSSKKTTISGTTGLLSYGDGGPQIQFSTSEKLDDRTTSGAQSGALIFTDHDAAATGASWHFVSNQSDWNVISKRFHARTSISIGTSLPNTSYNLYVNGTSYFNGNTTHNGIDYFANGTTYYINNSGTGNLNALTINSTTASTTTNTGGLIVKGGAGIAGRVTASEFNATRPMIINAGKVYSNISGSNVILPAKTTMLFANGIAIANPGLTAANDVGWLRVTGTAETDMALELATGDDGGTGETIHARQYNTSNTIVNDLTLLDTLGNTQFAHGFKIYYTTIPERTHINAAGWWKIAHATNYFNFDIYINGNWHTGSPSVTIINITQRNGTAIITQKSGLVGDIGSQIKLGKTATNEWDVLIYIPQFATDKNLGQQHYTFVGIGGLTLYQPSTRDTTTYSAETILELKTVSGVTATSLNVSWADWTNKTTVGPQANLNVAGTNIRSDSIPSASTSTSGIVTTAAQTFAGIKTFTNPETINTTGNGAAINFKFSNAPSANTIYGQNWIALANNGGRFYWREWGGTADGRTTGYEQYCLPACNTGRTTTATYDIFTSKNQAEPSKGTATRMAYYSAADTISAASNVQYIPEQDAELGTTKGKINGLFIYGTAYGNETVNLGSATINVFRYGDPGPQIRFSAGLGTANAGNAESSAIIWSNNSNNIGTDQSFHFVGQNNTSHAVSNVGIVTNTFIGKTRLTVGQNYANTTYTAYINGTTKSQSNLFVGTKATYNDDDAGWYLGADGTMWGTHASSGAHIYLKDDDNSHYMEINPDNLTGNIRLSGTADRFIMPKLNISSTADIGGKTSSSPPLSIGTLTSTHIEIDTNEILAKNSDTTTGVLYLQDQDGLTSVSGSQGLFVATTSKAWLAAHNASYVGGIRMSAATDNNGAWNWIKQENSHTDVKRWWGMGTVGKAWYLVTSASTRTSAGRDRGILYYGDTGKVLFSDGTYLETGNLTIGGASGTNEGKTIVSSSTLYLKTSSSASIIFSINDTNQARFDTHGYLRPEENNTLQVGTSAYKWNAMYATTFYGALSGHATSAGYLSLYEARATTTTLNKAAGYVTTGAMFHLIASSSTSTTDNGKPPMGDANILQMNWDNTGGYDAQLGISTAGTRMEFRGRASTKQAWREVVTITPGTAVGGTSTPIYIDSTGVAHPCTAYGSATDIRAATVNIHNDTTSKLFVLGATTTGYTSIYRESSVYMQNNVLMGAAWNDYAEFRQSKENKKIEPGRVVYENGDDTLSISTERLMRGCSIVSDTYGFGIGESEKAQLPIAVSGRVLAYPYENREEFKNHIGWPVCSGPNGTVSIMTEEEEMKYPSRIIGIISAVPDYEVWHGGADVIVDGRVWIKVR